MGFVTVSVRASKTGLAADILRNGAEPVESGRTAAYRLQHRVSVSRAHHRRPPADA